jgi:[ribosomal protein S18]-alanine N-acetyltransferase
MPDPGIVVRTATERDYPAIARIQQTSPEASQWPVGDYSGFNVFLALRSVEEKSVPAGFCAWRQVSDDEAEILNLAVDPASRRRGVAGALLAAIATEAKGDIFLEVSEKNLPAINLYDHHGWVRTGLRKNYYDQGSINAVVMRKRAC